MWKTICYCLTIKLMFWMFWWERKSEYGLCRTCSYTKWTVKICGNRGNALLTNVIHYELLLYQGKNSCHFMPKRLPSPGVQYSKALHGWACSWGYGCSGDHHTATLTFLHRFKPVGTGLALRYRSLFDEKRLFLDFWELLSFDTHPVYSFLFYLSIYWGRRLLWKSASTVCRSVCHAKPRIQYTVYTAIHG